MRFVMVAVAGPLVALALSACSGGNPSVGSTRPTERDSVFILVDNQNFLDTAVFVQYVGSGRRRLGSVSGQSRRRFSVRWEPAQIRFQVDFVGARLESTTDGLTPQRNELIELQIPSSSNRTGNLIIRRR